MLTEKEPVLSDHLLFSRDEQNSFKNELKNFFTVHDYDNCQRQWF